MGATKQRSAKFCRACAALVGKGAAAADLCERCRALWREYVERTGASHEI